MTKYQINLLPRRKKPNILTDKLIFFALHYLRYIIIVTQIIVIGVFFYRFWIDQQVINLKESINQKQEIIRITLPMVKEAQALEEKITVIKKILDKQKQFTAHFDYIVSIVPESISIKTLNLASDTIKIEGESTNINSIRTIFERLKRDQKFTNVVLSNVTKAVNLFTFSIDITI